MPLPIGPDPLAPMVECIFPGIDFANHSGSRPNARVSVAGLSGVAAKDGPGEPRVELVCEAQWMPAPGAEVLISYGEKANEELLFIHGFVERNNPHDVLVLHPPWVQKAAAAAAAAAAATATTSSKKRKINPPASQTEQAERVAAELEEEVRRSRVTLCRIRGLPNQVVLPASPPARQLAALSREVVGTLEVWGFTPQALEAELFAELGGTLGSTAEKEAEAAAKAAAGRRRPDAAERRVAAIAGLNDALSEQSRRLDTATGLTNGGAGGGGRGDGAGGGNPAA